MSRFAPWQMATLFLLWPAVASGQVVHRGAYDEAGERAYRAGRHAEAEQHFLIALKAADSLGPKDTRIAQALNNLGEIYVAQG